MVAGKNAILSLYPSTLHSQPKQSVLHTMRLGLTSKRDQSEARPLEGNPFLKSYIRTPDQIFAKPLNQGQGIGGANQSSTTGKPVSRWPGLLVFSVARPTPEVIELQPNLAMNIPSSVSNLGPHRHLVRLGSKDTSSITPAVARQVGHMTRFPGPERPLAISSNPPDPCKFRYYLGEGNNFQIIARVLATRNWWHRVSSSSDYVHLFMTQATRHFEFEKFSSRDHRTGQIARCLNRFEGYRQLTEKDLFFINLFKYCEKNRLNVYDFVPLTFVLDFEDPDFEKKLNSFAKVHQSITWFNRLLAQGTVTRAQSGQWSIKTADWLAVTGKTPKAAPKRSKKHLGRRSSSDSAKKAGESIQSRIRTKKICPLRLVPLAKGVKDTLDLTFLPARRKEYVDPTAKFRYSVPKLDDVFNRGHNIWYVCD